MKELTNSLRHLTASLDDTRHRRKENKFKAEGTKCVRDTIDSFKVSALLATGEWMEQNPGFASDSIILCRQSDMRAMSSFVTPPGVIAVYDIPEPSPVPSSIGSELTIALDTIRDPGNLGTIIRIADWFGIKHILASKDTTDCFSPKVIQATMGSISRVTVHYLDLPDTLAGLSDIYGTFLNGENIYSALADADTSRGVIVIGNESNGISAQVEKAVNHRITIPPFPAGAVTGESLNAAVATAITVAEFRRKAR